MKILILILLVLSTLSSAGATDPRLHKISAAALRFMEARGLIGKDQSIDLPDLGISIKWEPVSIVNYQGHDLVVMNMVKRMDDLVEKGDAFEVLVLKDKGFKEFKEVFAIPSRIIAKVGHADPKRRAKNKDICYFVELSGPSVAEAMKSIYSGQLYHGFGGFAIPGGKAKFDPTPGRTWRIVDATFSLRRGNTAEVLDIQSYQLDKDFDMYFGGAMTSMTSAGVVGAQVAPWGQSAVVELLPH